MASDRQVGGYDDGCSAIANSEVEIDVHVGGETIAFVEESYFLQEATLEGHTEFIDNFDFALLTVGKVTEVVGMETMQAGNPDVFVGQGLGKWSKEVASQFDA